jgi:hypothetical protein
MLPDILSYEVEVIKSMSSHSNDWMPRRREGKNKELFLQLEIVLTKNFLRMKSNISFLLQTQSTFKNKLESNYR